MKDDTRAALDLIFEKHEARKKTAEKAEEAKRSKEALFLEAFLQKRKGVIRPAMEEIGERVKQRGYGYQITNADDSFHTSTEASITLVLHAESDRPGGYNRPHFSVICDKHAGQVRFREDTTGGGHGGPAGSAGEATLEQLTPELIQEKILKMVAEVFR